MKRDEELIREIVQETIQEYRGGNHSKPCLLCVGNVREYNHYPLNVQAGYRMFHKLQKIADKYIEGAGVYIPPIDFVVLVAVSSGAILKEYFKEEQKESETYGS